MNVNRRDFLKLSLLSASAITFAACGRPVERGLVSQYNMPEYKLPGQSVFWASTCTELRSDCSVSVKTVENRAINVIGMPGHFVSKGAVTSTAISGLQALYHPARIRQSTGFADGANPAEVVANSIGGGGAQTLFVVDRLCGTAGYLMASLAREAGARIWVADSHHSVAERRILKQVVGRAELPFYPLESRDYVLTVGSNFLHSNYAPSRTGWAYGRFRKTPDRLRGRMVSFSARMNASDANSDVWLPLRPGSEPHLLAGVGTLVAERNGGDWPSWARLEVSRAEELTGIPEEALRKLADRLLEASAPLVIGGFEAVDGETTVFLAHSLTRLLTGDVPTFEPDLLVGGEVEGAGELFVDDRQAAELLSGAATVVVDGVDLVYRYPWLESAFESVKSRIVLASTPNDTTAKATQVVAVRNWLEDWSDLRVNSPDGEWYGLTQPAVSVQYPDTVSRLGFYLQLAQANGLEMAQEEIRPRMVLQGDTEKRTWENMLARGGVWRSEEEGIYEARSAYPPPPVANVGQAPEGFSPFTDLPGLAITSLGEPMAEGVMLLPIPSHLADGALADRPWMEELPDAMTTVVWDSWIEINEDVATQNGIARHDLVEVTTPAGSVVGSAIPSPFIHPSVIGIPKGRGHQRKAPTAFANIGWDSEGAANPMRLVSGVASSSGYFVGAEMGASFSKRPGSKLLATFDQRVYNLPRHILPE